MTVRTVVYIIINGDDQPLVNPFTGAFYTFVTHEWAFTFMREVGLKNPDKKLRIVQKAEIFWEGRNK